MQQSEAACQRTDVPTTMQQPEAVSQRTDVPTSMLQESQIPAPSAVIDVPAPGPEQCQRQDQEPRLGAPSYQDIGNKTRDILKGVYKTTSSYAHSLSGVDKDQKLMAGINTTVQLETREGEHFVSCQKGETVNSTEYAKLFRSRARTEELIKCLIFYGTGGVGKSTIFDQIAYDWACETSEILKTFRLVLLLKMCALSQKSNLVDATFDQLLGEKPGINKDELDKFILANPNEVLILLDGFDEMKVRKLNTASFGSILKALNRTVYKECFICVSTRPSHLETLSSTSKTLVPNPCTCVEVLGFTDEDVHGYIQKFYDEYPDSGKALLQTIEKSNMLRYLAKTPVLLHLMCLLWRESKQLPETMSRLFNEAIDLMFTRKHLCGEYASKTVIAIGQVALQGVTSANQKFAFQENEFEPKSLELALKAGILTRQRVFRNSKPHNNIQFMHKIVQECCAGKYFQSLNLSTLGLLKRVRNKFKYQGALSRLASTFEGVVSNEFLFRFCCGDNEKCTMDIVNLLDCKFNKDKPRYQASVIQGVCRNCFLESQSEKVPLCLTRDPLIPSTVEVCNNDDFQSLVYLLEIICRSDSCTAELARVETISLSRVYSSVTDLAFALGDMKNLRELKLNRCSLGDNGLVTLLPLLKCHQHLTDLCLVRCFARRSAKWAHHIKDLTSLNKLQLSCQALGWDSIEPIVLAVAQLPKLTDLSLAYNQRLGGTVDLWTKDLLKLEHINRLDLSECSFSRSDIEHIATAVADMPRLTELVLAMNPTWDVLTDIWATVLPQMKHLNFLDLTGMMLKPVDIEHIASSVGNLPKLTDLKLGGNSLLGGSAEMWAKELPRMRHLNGLALKCCSMLPSDIEHIAPAVGNMPKLTDLALGPNFKLGGSAELWAKELPQMVHLKKLGLRYCHLTASDMGHLASAVGDMPRLTHLNLDTNKALCTSAKLWAKELPKMKHLTELDLSNCDLTESDIGYVTGAAGSMPNLTNLKFDGKPEIRRI